MPLDFADLNVITIQLLALIAILAVAVCGGLIPLVSSQWAHSERFFSLGNAFAGGLFLGLGFIHLLPEGIELLAPYSSFPWGAFAGTAGFALLLLLDRILFASDEFSDASPPSREEALHPYVLLTMLSIHSIVAGIALGLETTVAGVVAMLFAIAFHKGPAAFALTVCAHSSGVSMARQWWFLALFCVMTPVGIVIGISSGVVWLESSDTYSILQGAFCAFAAGTFIYIAVIDIIDKELRTHHIDIAKEVVDPTQGVSSSERQKRHDDRLVKFLLIVVGIV
ncbi:MAG: hypothetical protein F4W90_08425, partial [Gammaproteobacteria bacterium]|nr:hypothetical protein [Gammaproteobacteria bacterium]